MESKDLEIALQVNKQYSTYHFGQISANRFSHKSFIEALKAFNKKKQLSISTIGHSEEGREIKSINYGNGKTNVLLWSQMHGNESTATRSILDMLNFLSAYDEFDPLREHISNELTMQFIPMLNPDGADRFQRRTSAEIDINRDAIALQTPEGRLLNKLLEDFKPNYAFNLHDQQRIYNVKNTDIPSSISFLAPVYNQAREVNASRKKAIQLIVGMNELLQNMIPGGVGLYDDSYNNRSFGDTIQSKGVSTVLIESGWMKNDMEKEQIRKLNFAIILKSFEMIASKSLSDFSVEQYNQIPSIDNKLFDVLIKNVKSGTTTNTRIDVGIRRTEHLLNQTDYFSSGQVGDIGDLSQFFGFETIDASSLTIMPGKLMPIDKLEDISALYVKKLLRTGVLFLLSTEIPFESHVPFPINIVHPRKLNHEQKLTFDGNANLLLVDNFNNIKYIIVNGFVMEPEIIDFSVNGLVLN